MAKNLNIDEMTADQLKEFVSNYYLMDCDMYLEEYKECKSFKGRFHQNFVLGEYSDCSTWKDDYKNCRKFMENEDLKAGARVVKNEIKRLERRIKAHLDNDVWTKRSEPPPNWNSKLPDWLEDKQRNAFSSENQYTNDMCVIS